MDLDQLHKRLIAAAKANTPSTDVPYAFERRIMERIRTTIRVDFWSVWSTILWRATAPCLGIMLLISIWTGWQIAKTSPADSIVNLNAELETTIYAGLDASDGIW